MLAGPLGMIKVIEKPDPALERELSDFLARRPRGASADHDPRWLAVLREGLGHRPFLLVARDSDPRLGPIVGYLPLALVASRLFGRFLVSLPYLNMAGVVADDANV